MELIPTKLHGILDYASGALFLAAPWVFGFADNKAATSVAVGTGAAVLGLSAFTDYEAGVARKIPMSTHLTIDTVTGAAVALSPWLFGFAKRTAWPHVVFGLLEVGAGMLTQKSPADSQ